MIKKAIGLLGGYLQEMGFTEDNLSEKPGEFSNEVFSFSVDPDVGTTIFWYYPEMQRFEWYLWVERSFGGSFVDMSADQSIDLLMTCLQSLSYKDQRVFDDESGITFVRESVLDEWVPVDPEEDS